MKTEVLCWWNSPKNSSCKRSFLITVGAGDQEAPDYSIWSLLAACILREKSGSFLVYVFSLIKQVKDRLKWKFWDTYRMVVGGDLPEQESS